MRKPDFNRLRETLLGRKADAIPLAELFWDAETMDGFMGKPVLTTLDYIDFATTAGYDYISIGYQRWFQGVPEPAKERENGLRFRALRSHRQAYSEPASYRGIHNLAEFEAYCWDWLTPGDLSLFDWIAEYLPSGMKVVAISDGIFEFFTKRVGYENFCYALVDDMQFIKRVFDEVGSRYVEAFDAVLEHEIVGAMWLPDDLGCSHGLLWSPELMREVLFPWYRRLGDVARRHDKPFVFHSDGCLWEIIPDLVAAGVNAIHPIEPKAWSAREVKERYGDKLCLMGTIDMDLLCRGTPQEVESMVKEHIEVLGGDGGFVIGTSNTPAYYVLKENFRAMVETCLQYGSYNKQKKIGV